MRIPPQPRPTQWGFDHAEGGSHVVVVANTELGDFVHFVDVGNIDAFCAALQQEKAKCEEARKQPDIVVPGQTLLGPDGNPLSAVAPSQEVMDHLAKMRAGAIDVEVVDETTTEPTDPLPGDDVPRDGDDSA